MNKIKEYLRRKSVNADKIYTFKHKGDENKFLMKLAINLNFDNLMNFYKNIEIHYSRAKSEKLINTLNNLKTLKLERFNELTNTLNKLTKRNYSEQWVKNNLRLIDKSLNFILEQRHLKEWK